MENAEKTKNDKEWSTVWEKGFESRLLAEKVLAPRVSIMKTTVFNRVR